MELSKILGGCASQTPAVPMMSLETRDAPSQTQRSFGDWRESFGVSSFDPWSLANSFSTQHLSPSPSRNLIMSRAGPKEYEVAELMLSLSSSAPQHKIYDNLRILQESTDDLMDTEPTGLRNSPPSSGSCIYSPAPVLSQSPDSPPSSSSILTHLPSPLSLPPLSPSSNNLGGSSSARAPTLRTQRNVAPLISAMSSPTIMMPSKKHTEEDTFEDSTPATTLTTTTTTTITTTTTTTTSSSSASNTGGGSISTRIKRNTTPAVSPPSSRSQIGKSSKPAAASTAGNSAASETRNGAATLPTSRKLIPSPSGLPCPNCNVHTSTLWRTCEVANGNSHLCNACGLRFKKGKYCPLCFKVYYDADTNHQNWKQCQFCYNWTHKECLQKSRKSEEKAKEKSEEDEGDEKSDFSFRESSYKCITCKRSQNKQ